MLDINEIVFLAMMAFTIVIFAGISVVLLRRWEKSSSKDKVLDAAFLLSLWQWAAWMPLYVHGIPPTDSSTFWNVMPYPSLIVPLAWCILRRHPI